MTEELADKDNLNQKTSKKAGTFVKLMMSVFVVFCGYLIVEYVQEKVRQKEIAKQEIAVYDNVETEIFDLAKEENEALLEEADVRIITVEDVKAGGAQFIQQELVASNSRIDKLYKDVVEIKDEIFKYKSQEKIGRLILSYLDLRNAFLQTGNYQDVLKNFEMLVILDDNLKDEIERLKPLLPKFLRKNEISQKFNDVIPELMAIKGAVDDSLLSRIEQKMSKLVVVRRIDGQISNPADKLDAIIVKVETLLRQEQYQSAWNALKELQPKYQNSITLFLDDLDIIIKVRAIDLEIINHLKGLA